MLMYKEGLVGPSAAEITQQMIMEGNDVVTVRIVGDAMRVNERREMNTFLHSRISAGVYEFLETREVQLNTVDDCINQISVWIEAKLRSTKAQGGVRSLQEAANPNGQGTGDEHLSATRNDGRIATQQSNTGYMSSYGQKGGGYKDYSTGKGDGGEAPPAGTPVCTTCRGSHPDVRGCPNGLAKHEPGFVNAAVLVMRGGARAHIRNNIQRSRHDR